MVKQAGIYFMSTMKYYSAQKGEWAIDTSNNLDEYWKSYVESEKPISECCVLFDSILKL